MLGLPYDETVRTGEPKAVVRDEGWVGVEIDVRCKVTRMWGVVGSDGGGM